MSGSPVKLYVYELSNGLARQMSPLLLGKQIDGIWHTGVVCFGREFFFGGGGIESCPPGGTVLGMPDEIISLGDTHITEDLFLEYLRGLGSEEFRPEMYHLFEHNCNTFSNEVAIFLTGKKIPRHIQDLPKDVLNSAFGQMIKPLVDSMRVTPAGGASVVNNTRQPSSSAPSSANTQSTATSSRTQEGNSNPESIFEPRDNLQDGPAGTDAGPTEPLPPSPVVFSVTDVSNSFIQLKEELSHESEDDVSTLDELSEAVMSKSVTEEHVKYIDNTFQQCLQGQGRCLLFMLEILQMVCLDKHFMQLPSVRKFLWTVIQEFSSYCSSRPSDVHIAGIKALCNAISNHAGHSILLTDSPPPHLSSVASCSVLHEQDDIATVGAALTFNIARYKVDEDIALECSTAIIEVLNKGVCDKTAYHCLYALQRFMQCSPEIPGLAAVMGVELTRYQGQTDEMDGLCKQLQSLMS